MKNATVVEHKLRSELAKARLRIKELEKQVSDYGWKEDPNWGQGTRHNYDEWGQLK